MKNYLILKLPSGHTFEIPTGVIASNRAAYMLGAHPGEFADMDAAMADTVELFDDAYEVWDWISNNMNIDEVAKQHARLIAYQAPALNFDDADRAMTDNQSRIKAITGDNVLQAPLSILIDEMAQSNTGCNVYTLNKAEDGHPRNAVVLLSGGPAAIKRYLDALQEAHNSMTPPVVVTQNPATDKAH